MRLPWRRGERASSLDLLVVGLGNPGREYVRNRHNVGQMVVDELARRHDGAWKSKFSGQLADVRIDGHKVALLKPETFMNDSGRSVKAAAQFYKLEPDAIKTSGVKGNELAQLVQLLETRVRTLIEGIDRGETLPAWGDASTCIYCRYEGLCRKEMWSESDVGDS